MASLSPLPAQLLLKTPVASLPEAFFGGLIDK
jgi:hypothetical protein